ncbi:MAG: DUF5606 domain-containing protein [Bacteroidales bacterium]|nr:DUF5606 domain-containing protein [Bacteroidales bacterium]
MKTDLKITLAISGQSGLYKYLAQAKNGMIVESLATGSRTAFGPSARVTSLADVSIYTTEDEVSLRQVLENMAKELAGGPAPSSKSDNKVIKDFFEKVLPNYDGDRFYVSHMKKVLDWYNALQQFASLEFVDDEEENKEETSAE